MANSFFRFKQFTIHQDRCAMKVCTDACVFGAWTDARGAKTVLDIGAGTGLLSLMLAQRFAEIKIHSVEIDPNAFVQATENVSASPFAERVRIAQTAIQDFDPGFKFDLIISNPPFYQNDLKSPKAGKNQAHHSDSLTFSELIIAVERLLSPDGEFAVLLPAASAAHFEKLAGDAGMQVWRHLSLFHQEGRAAFRALMVLTKKNVEKTTSRLHIYQADGKSYDPAFKELMKDFYIHF